MMTAVCDVEQALARIEQGDLVAIPTETVYGLAVDADNDQAIEKLYAAKQRPSDHPVIVHIASADQAEHWTSAINETASALMREFWPGPLTLVLARKGGRGERCAAGQDSIALRCPSHPLVRELLQRFRSGAGGLAAPSANRFGEISPTLAEHVWASLGSDLPVLDGGACAIGIESTIVDARGEELVLLRPGGISANTIEAACGRRPHTARRDSPRVSGDMARHYAPKTPLGIVDTDSLRVEPPSGVGLVWMGAQQARGFSENVFAHCVEMPNSPLLFSQKIYAILHRLDTMGLAQIWVQTPPDTDEWRGVNDRLNRASNLE